ncbi:arginase family protein [Deinococcus cellulosilyticus]|uniref:Arginase n=1 Tax=Deinococcus cellulosilyticus (strain DSM 18568 / NBRC 106333 / KACC 11606 / 5516J-15) TaxID=1223518 RepID=A0A511MXA1_DEIC1|nr:arginase family protein [Deinococcus cellulosilyticus]GEM44991.1 arginase [Deinococcus cellulosilyticus NBRC 106333 = KACC 11606]
MDFSLLSFPQWQGSDGRTELHSGAQLLASTFGAEPLLTVSTQATQVEQNIWGRRTLIQHFLEAQRQLKGRNLQQYITLGGDCAIEWALISHLNELCRGNLLVVWLDGHADLNTPETSYSHTFHGMVLRTLLGEGDPEFLALTPSFLRPEQVVLAGVRELDTAEEAYIREQDITLLDAKTLRADPGMLLEAAHQKGFEHLYVHVDLDVLDPSQISSIGWPAPEGLLLQDLLDLIHRIKTDFHIQGASITEYLGEDIKDLVVVQDILEAFRV